MSFLYLGRKNDDKKIAIEFGKTEKTSIDYAVAEHIDQKQVLIIKKNILTI